MTCLGSCYVPGVEFRAGFSSLWGFAGRLACGGLSVVPVRHVLIPQVPFLSLLSSLHGARGEIELSCVLLSVIVQRRRLLPPTRPRSPHFAGHCVSCSERVGDGGFRPGLKLVG